MAQEKQNGASVQALLGVKTFTDYGLSTNKGELLFFLVTPSNISVLSTVAVEVKIRQLMLTLSALPDVEIVCADSSECFDENKAYLIRRREEEPNAKIRKLLGTDLEFLGEIQLENHTENDIRAGVRRTPHDKSGNKAVFSPLLRRFASRRVYARRGWCAVFCGQRKGGKGWLKNRYPLKSRSLSGRKIFLIVSRLA